MILKPIQDVFFMTVYRILDQDKMAMTILNVFDCLIDTVARTPMCMLSLRCKPIISGNSNRPLYISNLILNLYGFAHFYRSYFPLI